jgi:hypothetical protein
MSAAMKTEGRREENDAIEVGDIAEMIARRDFQGARVRLDQAKADNRMKTETYINLRTTMAKEAYSDAQSYINKAMQPGELELDFYKQQKHADASAELARKAAAGRDPMDAAKEIVSLYRADRAKSVDIYRNPKFLQGDKRDTKALDLALQRTVQAYQAGKISTGEYTFEVQLISNIMTAVRESVKSEEADTSLQEEIKRRKIGK